jgi:hypothetical protein
MQDDEVAGPLAAAMRLETDARAVADSTAKIVKPSEVSEVIGTLSRIQQVMSQVYSGLASWHAAVELGVHHAGEREPDGPQNPGWVRAEMALEEASQYSRDAASALERARTANMSARWFDEIRADGV